MQNVLVQALKLWSDEPNILQLQKKIQKEDKHHLEPERDILVH